MDVVIDDKQFVKEDLKSTSKSAYVVYEGDVFEISKFLPKHPGGSAIVKEWLDKDISRAFVEAGHSAGALKQLKEMKVGTYGGNLDELEAGKGFDESAPPAARWTRKMKVFCCSKIDATSAVELQLRWDDVKMEKDDEPLRIGQHVMLRLHIPGKCDVTRPYTPVEIDGEGLVLAIRLYEKGEMSSAIREWIVETQEGNLSITVEGPYGSMELQDKAVQLLSPSSFAAVESVSSDQYVFIAGGTGITPFLALLRSKKPKKAKMLLLVSDVSEALYLSELKEYVKEDKLDVTVVVTAGSQQLNTVEDGIRWVTTTEMYIGIDTLQQALSTLQVSQHVKNQTFVICGPPPMENAIVSLLQRDALNIPAQAIVATTQAGARAMEQAQSQVPRAASSLTGRNGPFPGNQHFWYFAFGMVLPIVAVALNSGAPFDGSSYWPQTDATGKNATGMNGKFDIYGFGNDCPNNLATCYVYVLRDPEMITLIMPWILYILHYSAVLFVQYKAFVLSPKYSNEFRWFNWALLAINTVGAMVKYINSSFNYNGLAATLPIGWGVGTIMSYLSIVHLMYIPVRGIFFGYGANWDAVNEVADFLRKYHGFYIGFIIVNDFWFHPFESSPGHLVGILNEALLLWQIVSIYTPSHVNRWWCFLIETMVIGHAFLIAMLRNEPAGAVGYFGFGYVLILAVTQIHGLGLSRAIRGVVCGFCLAALLLWYGLKAEGIGFEGLPRVFSAVPPLQYGLCVVFVLFYYLLKLPLKVITGRYTRYVYYIVASFFMMVVGAGPMLLLFSRSRRDLPNNGTISNSTLSP